MKKLGVLLMILCLFTYLGCAQEPAAPTDTGADTGAMDEPVADEPAVEEPAADEAPTPEAPAGEEPAAPAPAQE